MKALMSYRFNAIIFIFLSIALFSSNANAQTVEPADPSLLELLGVPVEEDEDEYYYEDEGEGYDDFGPFFDLVADTVPDSVPEYTPLKLLPPTTLPVTAFMPVVFDYVEYTDTVSPLNPERYIETDNPAMNRMMQEGNRIRRYRQLKQRYMIDYAPQVRYNINTLPEPPKQYVPYIIAGKEPTRYCGINIVGLRRRGFSNETIDIIHDTYRTIYANGIIKDGIQEARAKYPGVKEVEYICSFIENSKRGIIR